jgi:hypothetical protein
VEHNRLPEPLPVRSHCLLGSAPPREGHVILERYQLVTSLFAKELEFGTLLDNVP